MSTCEPVIPRRACEPRDLAADREIPRYARDDTRVNCPFCDADTCELISLFGSQLLLSQYRCKRCGSYFEAVRGGDEHGS